MNVRKKLRNSGQSYVNNKKKTMPARKMRPPCNAKCRLKCTTKISYDIRKQIHTNFWKLSDLSKQRSYIVGHTAKIARSHHSKQLKSQNLAYIMTDEKIKVCKTMFINTLGISDRYVYSSWSMYNESGLEFRENRGRYPRRKLDDNVISFIHDHISSFPTIESHYLRQQTKRIFIDGFLTLSEMYRMYVQKCINDGRPYAQEHKYREIFNYNFNIGFHIPRKDQCAICHQYENASSTEKEIQRKSHDDHLKKKVSAREQKSRDITLASNDTDYMVCDFDLQVDSFTY